MCLTDVIHARKWMAQTWVRESAEERRDCAGRSCIRLRARQALGRADDDTEYRVFLP